MEDLVSRSAALFIVLAATISVHAQALPGQCGYKRWPVKILADKDASKINFTPIDTTIADLVAIPIHEVRYPNNHRIPPEELRVYRVKARLLAVIHERDHDLHLIIADPDNPEARMIAEIPAPECVTSHRDEYKAAREVALRGANGVLVELEGVGFFDFLHDQRGLAKNGIELHPVLSLRVLDSHIDAQKIY